MCSTESESVVHQCLPVLGLLCSPVTDVTANRRYEFSDPASHNVTVTQQFFSVSPAMVLVGDRLFRLFSVADNASRQGVRESRRRVLYATETTRGQ